MDSSPSRIAETSADLEGALRVGRNFSFRLASQVISALINVAGMVLLANALAPGGYGEYAFCYALIPLIASASDLGVGIIVTREIARDPEGGPRGFGDALMIKGAASALILLVALGIAWSALDPARATLISLVTAAALIDPNQDASIWILRAHERQHMEALLLILSQGVWLAALGAGVLLHAPLPWLLAAAALGYGVRLAAGAAIVWRRLYRPRFEPDGARIRRLLAQGLPFGTAMFGVVLYGRVGLLMLRGLTTPQDVAYFNVAYLLSQPLGFISSALSLAAFPLLARQAGGEALRRGLRRTLKYQTMLALPITVGLWLLAEPIMSLLFHQRGFRPAGIGLRVISAGLPLIFFNLSARYLLAALDRQRHYLRAIAAGLGVNLLLCAALVPSLGFLGACAAYLGAETTIATVCLRALSPWVRLSELARDAVKPLLAAVAMGLLLLPFRGANVVLAAMAGGVTYGALLLLLQAFSEDELRSLRRLGVSFGLPGSTSLESRTASEERRVAL